MGNDIFLKTKGICGCLSENQGRKLKVVIWTFHTENKYMQQYVYGSISGGQ